MAEPLDDATIAVITEALRARRDELLADLAGDRSRTSEGRIGQYAGEVHDRGEEASVDSQAEINSAVMGHHQTELGEVERALARIETGTYGTCVVCGDDIDAGRLRAQPTAWRCHDCQSRAEDGGR